MRHTCSVLLFVLLLVTIGAAGIGNAQVVVPMDDSSGAPPGVNTTLVVNDNGTAEYTSIQAAVDDATPGDTVVVRPGTYREQVTIGKNITVVAPDGATLDGSQFDDRTSAFRIQDGVVPVVDGFTIRDYAYGINAERPPRMGLPDSAWEVGWIVRNVTIRNCSEEAIRAGNSKVDWTIENVRIDGHGCYVGIAAFGAYGDWTIKNTVIHDVAFSGINLEGVRGTWTIRNTSITDAGEGIDAGWSHGNGTITDTTIRNVRTGIAIDEMFGTITITDTVIRDISHPPDDPTYNGVAVYAANTSGDWRIRESIIRNYTRYGINATDASPPGDATENWWGKEGPSENACIGNVRCDKALSDRPEAGTVLDNLDMPRGTATSDTATPTPAPTSEFTTDDRPTSSTPTRAGDQMTPSTEINSTSVRTDRPPSTDGGSLPLAPLIGGVVVLAAVVIGGLVGGLFVRTRG